MPSTVWTWVDKSIALVCWSLFGLVLVSVGLKHAHQEKKAPLRYSLSLSSTGILSQFVVEPSGCWASETVKGHTSDNGATTMPMQIHSSSQLFPWGLCIEVASVKYKWFERGHTHFRWVLKNECSEANYRRLCRAIILAKKGTD